MGSWKNNGKHSTTLSLSDDGLRILDKEELTSCIHTQAGFATDRQHPFCSKAVSCIPVFFHRLFIIYFQYVLV